MKHSTHGKTDMKAGHTGQDHHRMMMADYRKRFFISLALTMPVLIFSQSIRDFFNLTNTIGFAGDQYLVFGLATGIFFYGGFPFLKGLSDEVRSKNIGMMTLIGVAIGKAVLLGASHPGRCHAGWALGRDEVDNGGITSFGRTGPTDALGSP
jgi:Cu2+-exporting ATPase